MRVFKDGNTITIEGKGQSFTFQCSGVYYKKPKEEITGNFQFFNQGTDKSLLSIPFQEITDETGTPVGTTVDEVDTYLRGLFDCGGGSLTDPIPQSQVIGLEDRFEAIEDTQFEITYYEEIDISTATGSLTGSIPFPTGSTLEEIDYPGNSLLAVLNAQGQVTDQPPRDSNGTVISSTLDSLGNWVVTANSSDRVGIVFRIFVPQLFISGLDPAKVIDDQGRSFRGFAEDIFYNNSNSDLESENVQDAIDELTTFPNQIRLNAGEPISMFRAVKIVNEEIFLADNTDINNYDLVVGISRNAAITGNPVSVVIDGILDVSPMILTPNAIYYLNSTTGVLSTTPPSGGVCIPVGYSIGSSKFFVDVKQSVILA